MSSLLKGLGTLLPHGTGIPKWDRLRVSWICSLQLSWRLEDLSVSSLYHLWGWPPPWAGIEGAVADSCITSTLQNFQRKKSDFSSNSSIGKGHLSQNPQLHSFDHVSLTIFGQYTAPVPGKNGITSENQAHPESWGTGTAFPRVYGMAAQHWSSRDWRCGECTLPLVSTTAGLQPQLGFSLQSLRHGEWVQREDWMPVMKIMWLAKTV